jgi:hypothetical protein
VSAKIKFEIEKRLIDRLNNLESGRIYSGTQTDQVRSLIDLYMAYLRSQRSNWPKISNAEAAEINRTAASNLLNFINLDPFMGRIRKAITVLMAGDVKKALEILQKIVDEQNEIIGEIQGNNRRGKTKDSSFKGLLKEILRKNPDITTKGVLSELENQSGKGVIKRIKHDTDQIITAKSEEYKISGLKDLIYKAKKSGL